MVGHGVLVKRGGMIFLQRLLCQAADLPLLLCMGWMEKVPASMAAARRGVRPLPPSIAR